MNLKICGLCRIADIEYVNEYKPDYIGFVFADSKRQVSLPFAKELKALLDPQIKAVGVFVNAELSLIERALREQIIDLVQLHGQEDEDYIRSVRAPVIKAIHPGEPIPSCADYLLFDGQEAGSGVPFDWSLLPKTDKPFFLAGGITAQNLFQAMQYHPFAIDISSGVETDGHKDRDKIKKMVRSVHDV